MSFLSLLKQSSVGERQTLEWKVASHLPELTGTEQICRHALKSGLSSFSTAQIDTSLFRGTLDRGLSKGSSIRYSLVVRSKYQQCRQLVQHNPYLRPIIPSPLPLPPLHLSSNPHVLPSFPANKNPTKPNRKIIRSKSIIMNPKSDFKSLLHHCPLRMATRRF